MSGTEIGSIFTDYDDEKPIEIPAAPPISAEEEKELGGPQLADPNQKAVGRVPVIILVDVSASTDSDMPSINAGLQYFADLVKNPPLSDDKLNDLVSQLDILLIEYHTDVHKHQWTTADDLQSFPMLESGGATSTITAMWLALRSGLARARLIKNQRVKSSIPYIFHITDGAPNDYYPGQPEYDELKKYISTGLRGNADGKPYISIINFITHDGYTYTDDQGRTGADVMAELCGAETVRELPDSTNAFELIFKAIISIVTQVTQAGADPIEMSKQFGMNFKEKRN